MMEEHVGISRSHGWVQARWGEGVEPPGDSGWQSGPQLVERSFVFLDLCSFTSFCDQAGPLRATEELDRFRSVVRGVSSRRGVRVAKWLGDGAMLVSVDPGPALAAAVEVVGRVTAHGVLSARGGVGHGAALLFDGDDHIGRPVNLAARLCDIAELGEVLAPCPVVELRPGWVHAGPVRMVEIRGLDAAREVQPVRADTSIDFVELDGT